MLLYEKKYSLWAISKFAAWFVLFFLKNILSQILHVLRWNDTATE